VPENRENVEREQIRTLALLLGRLFRNDNVSVLVEQRLKSVAKRLTKLFFESEEDDRYAELYLNIDVAGARIELNEKDDDYRKALVLALADAGSGRMRARRPWWRFW